MTTAITEVRTTLEVMGNSLRVLVSGDDTRGAYTLMDYVAGASFGGPPAHRHGFDELFLVLEGSLTLEVNGKTLVAKPGDHALVPGGAAHRFSNPNPEPARFLCVMSPPGFEAYFEELKGVLDRGESYHEVAASLMPKYGLTPA